MEIDVALRAAAAIAGAAALGQILTRRLPIPLPVFLLAVGLLLGHDGLGVVETAEIADLARVAVVLAVALIVFEGGTALRLRMLRLLGPTVRNLVVLGLIITPIAGALGAHYFLDFGWRASALFGALVSVTGPSVITPLLQSIRVNERVGATLASEGVIIDPLGALLTLSLLQVAVAESFDPAQPAEWVVTRVGVGVASGAAGAFAAFAIARVVQRLSSREVSFLVVGAAVVAFATAESLAHEAGLTAMVVMGIALGNLPIPHREAVNDFQESIVAFLIATVYVLLAASVSLDALWDLWPGGIFVVALLAIVGRPLLVVVSTWRSNLDWRERAFLSAVAPRGVVAASLAAVVAVEAGELTGARADEFVAMVFVVILLTIGIQSAYAGSLARLLKVQPMTTVVAGAGEVGRRTAALLMGAGEPVRLIDVDGEAAVKAREEGLDVLIGDISDVEVLRRAGVGDAKAFILTTRDDARNLLAAQLARSRLGCEAIYARVNETQNVEAFQSIGVTVVSQAEAVAAQMAHLVAEPVLHNILSMIDEDVSVARVVVTNRMAQRPIQSIPQLRGTLVIMMRRGHLSVIPNGKTELQIGDVVTIFGKVSDLAVARAALETGAATLPARW
ncbi:MAG: cation:proton antiporter [Dehalococcoidia bacterium]